MSRPHEDIINLTLESEEAFRGYIADNDNVRRVFKAFKRLLSNANRAFDDGDRLAAEVETLKERNKALVEDVKEQQDARMRMEGALTYVEEQLATLRAFPAAPPAAPPSSPTPSGSDDTPTDSQSNKVKVDKIPDPPKFSERRTRSRTTTGIFRCSIRYRLTSRQCPRSLKSAMDHSIVLEVSVPHLSLTRRAWSI